MKTAFIKNLLGKMKYCKKSIIKYNIDVTSQIYCASRYKFKEAAASALRIKNCGMKDANAEKKVLHRYNREQEQEH